LVLIIAILCILTFLENYCDISKLNKTKVINVELFVDDEKIENKEVAYSFHLGKQKKLE
jgi:hypothetical protein